MVDHLGVVENTNFSVRGSVREMSVARELRRVVIKRNGQEEEIAYDKIATRIKNLMTGLDQRYVNHTDIQTRVIAGMADRMTTEQLDRLAAEAAAYKSSEHPDYGKLAARIFATNLHKKTDPNFSVVMSRLADVGLVTDEIMEVVRKFTSELDGAIDYNRDLEYTYFGLVTLEKSYLMRIQDVVVERPQQLLMRVAIQVNEPDDLEGILQTYGLLSRKMFTFATPTLQNAGTNSPQMSSCFLLEMTEDSIEGIFETLKRCALVSKGGGGVGLNVTKIRAKDSHIKGTNGKSSGIVKMIRNFNATAVYVDQGGGKRKGSFALYLEPWHADVEDFLVLKSNTTKEEFTARDLFYGLWVPDLFMERAEKDEMWTLFCPNDVPGLADCWGDEFNRLYLEYEKAGKGRRQVRAQELLLRVVNSQIEVGGPYILYKDECNRKSNQQNLGTIKCSNLCTEIIQYSSPDEVAVCNLASINLAAFVTAGGGYDFDGLRKVAGIVVKNLNRIIDKNRYPLEQARSSNLRHRPVGVGVQGLADVFALMGLPFTSPEAKRLNRDIFETLYYGCLEKSVELAVRDGPYESFPGSPLSEGRFQFDLWSEQPNPALGLDWEYLRGKPARNSLLVALMPTQSTSQILGANECFEPFTSNLYSRKTMAGDFVVINEYLVKKLVELGLWSVAMKQKIVNERGSVQNIPEIPADVKKVFLNFHELRQRDIIDMAADRGAFVDNSQSMNLRFDSVNPGKLISSLYYSKRKGLKTACYYTHINQVTTAIPITASCSAEICTSCSS